MSDSLDKLLDLLDLEQIEVNIFRGRSPDETVQRVFGGQVAGQALVAAGRTVPEDRPVHSLHAYFIRPGDPSVPLVYTVDRVRDGRSFTTRRVNRHPARQADLHAVGLLPPAERGPRARDADAARAARPRRSLPERERLADGGRRAAAALLPGQPDRAALRRPAVHRAGPRPGAARRTTTATSSGCASRRAPRRPAAARVPDDLHLRPDAAGDRAARARGHCASTAAPAGRAWTTPCGSTARSAPTSGCSTRRRPDRRRRPGPRPRSGVHRRRATSSVSVVQEGLIRISDTPRD